MISKSAQNLTTLSFEQEWWAWNITGLGLFNGKVWILHYTAPRKGFDFGTGPKSASPIDLRITPLLGVRRFTWIGHLYLSALRLRNFLWPDIILMVTGNGMEWMGGRVKRGGDWVSEQTKEMRLLLISRWSFLMVEIEYSTADGVVPLAYSVEVLALWILPLMIPIVF